MYKVHYFFKTYNGGKVTSSRLAYTVTDSAGIDRLVEEGHSIVCWYC